MIKNSSIVAAFLAITLTACNQVAVDSAIESNIKESSSTSSTEAAQAASSAKLEEKPVMAMEVKSSKGMAASSVASSVSSKEKAPELTEDQKTILYKGGTESPFTSELVNEHRKGTYYSVDCDVPMFRSEQKFDSGTGWPSFWAPARADALMEDEDTTAGMSRTEVKSKCGGHLGHVFNDGPKPTGLRYCINGLVLRFVPDEIQ